MSTKQVLLFIITMAILGLVFIAITHASDMEILYDGVAPDQRDYIIQYRAPGEQLVIEDHFQLYPQSQWLNRNKAAYAQQPYATFKDWDGDGKPSEWWSHSEQRRYIWDYDFHAFKGH